MGNGMQYAGQFMKMSAENDGNLVNRIFGIDGQLGADLIITVLAVIFLFFLLSYLVFNPARELLKKRQARIQGDMDMAVKDKEEAEKYKADYFMKLSSADKEAEEIISEGRKKALKQEEEIVEKANEEAGRICERAKKEAVLEKNKMQDEFKQEMVSVAAVMAEKMLKKSIDESRQAELIEEAINEMGDETWRK